MIYLYLHDIIPTKMIKGENTGWASSLYAGEDFCGWEFSFFDVSVSLTDAGHGSSYLTSSYFPCSCIVCFVKVSYYIFL